MSAINPKGPDMLRDIDYLIDDVVADAYVRGAEGRDTETSPQSAKTLHDAISEALAARIVPEGWKLVPVKATPEMLQAACDATYGPEPFTPEDYHRMGYKAMLASSPAANVPPQVNEAVTGEHTEKRKHGYTVNLTEQEMDALEALAKEHDLPPWRVLLQGLRLYQLVAHPVDLGPMLDPSLASPSPGTATAAARETAWLVERTDLKHPEWWSPGPPAGDYADANVAMRFARQQDAETFIRLERLDPAAYRATEHVFIQALGDQP